LDTVQHIEAVSDFSVRDVLDQLDMAHATYYRWQARAGRARLADTHTPRVRQSVSPTPKERAAVCDFARAHPLMGYKRLTWDMVDRDIGGITSWTSWTGTAAISSIGNCI